MDPCMVIGVSAARVLGRASIDLVLGAGTKMRGAKGLGLGLDGLGHGRQIYNSALIDLGRDMVPSTQDSEPALMEPSWAVGVPGPRLMDPGPSTGDSTLTSTFGRALLARTQEEVLGFLCSNLEFCCLNTDLLSCFGE
ncbi:GATA-type domain-containing protein [Psidium guajava]|nr:GATA-type domain-containing protein [Psidium guajava]